MRKDSYQPKHCLCAPAMVALPVPVLPLALAVSTCTVLRVSTVPGVTSQLLNVVQNLAPTQVRVRSVRGAASDNPAHPAIRLRALSDSRRKICIIKKEKYYSSFFIVQASILTKNR